MLLRLYGLRFAHPILEVNKRRKVDKASPAQGMSVQGTPILLTLPSGARILHTKCKEVKEITSEIESFAQVLEDYLKSHQNDEPRPIGIAAPQLGKTLRMFSCVLDLAGEPITIINPELVYEKKHHLTTEMCLSIPNRKFRLKRGRIVKIRGTLLNGSPRSYKSHGVIAQMFLHELNHLDGITIDMTGQRLEA